MNIQTGSLNNSKKRLSVPGIVAPCLLLVLLVIPCGEALAGGTHTTIPVEPSASEPGDEIFTSEVVSRIGRFRSPTRILLDDDGVLYVSDTGRGLVALYDQDGVRVGTLAGVHHPIGVAILETRVPAPGKDLKKKKKRKRSRAKLKKYIDKTYIYVADEADGSVKIFDDGELIGHLGDGPVEFARPNGVAAINDLVYVVDSDEDRVAIYDKDGAFLYQFGTTGAGDGQFDFPTDIAIDTYTEEIYVGDLRNKRVQVFDLHGNWLRTIYPPLNDGGDPIFINPAGLGIDPLGNIYVVDNALCCVAVLDPFGVLLDVYGYQNGAYWTGELQLPIDAASDGLKVFVTSGGEGHVNVFEVTP